MHLLRVIRGWLLWAGVLGMGATASAAEPYLIGTNWWFQDPGARALAWSGEAGIRLVRIGGIGYDRKPAEDQTLVGWVRQIRGFGAEPLIQVSQFRQPEDAARLVALLNVEKKADRPVRFWSIGNEPWLEAKRPPMAGMAARIRGYFKPIAAAMKAVDPTITIVGPDECDYFDDVYTELFTAPDGIGGRIPGKDAYYCDVISWHRYPQTEGEPGLAEIEDFRERIQRCAKLVERANAMHGRAGDAALSWGITEFNAKGGKQVHTFGNGQLFAAVIGMAHLAGARMALSWSMFESGGNRGKTDFGLFDGRDQAPRASAVHMGLYLKYLQGTPVPVAVQGSPVLGFCARRPTAWGVLLLNPAAEATAYRVSRSRGAAGGGDRAAQVVIADVPEEFLGILPPRSSLVWSWSEGAAHRFQYTPDDFANARPPSPAGGEVVVP